MKRVLSILLCLIMVMALIPFSASADWTGGNYGEKAYEYVKYLDENLIQRTAGTEQETLTAAFIYDELVSFGYEPTYQPFSYVRRNTTYNSQNVVAVKPGNSEKTIIVGAHYDCANTHGVDDNGSGVSVTLETAKRMYNVQTPYTIIFVFFGAEEVGLQGSAAYANSMSEEDIANTICMINLDSILAGTYRYVYSGTVEKDAEGNVVVDEDGNPVVGLSWPFYQAMQVSEEFGLDMHSNDTELNFDYPAPSTGTWSDHQSFRNKNIPYLYFEAANWELPDYPDYPEYGSSGAYETEIGEVMHVASRDNLEFIENEWGTRAKDTLTAYSILLPQLLLRMDPDGLLPASENYSLLNAAVCYDGEPDFKDEYDGSPVYVGVNQTVAVSFDGLEGGKIGVFNENGKGIYSQSVFSDGKWTTTFSVGSKGERTLSIRFNKGGEWVDTGIEVKLIVGSENVSPAEAKVISASPAVENVSVNTPFTYTVITSPETEGLGIFNENGKGISKKVLSTELVDGQKVWTLSSSIGSKGDRTFSVKALMFDGTWSDEGVSFAVSCK